MASTFDGWWESGPSRVAAPGGTRGMAEAAWDEAVRRAKEIAELERDLCYLELGERLQRGEGDCPELSLKASVAHTIYQKIRGLWL
jgi:hypothetical protein